MAAVEAAILDKNLVRPIAGNNHASKIDAWNVAFEAARVAGRTAVLPFDANAQRLEKFEIRKIAGESKDKVVGQGHRTLGRDDGDGVRIHAGDATFEIRCDLTVLNAIFDVWKDPV